MRTFHIPLLLLALGFAACTYDPVAACESRCEAEKDRDCNIAPAIECETQCQSADDTYDMGLNTAEERGCVGEYQNYVSCLDGVPICADLPTIGEMCAEEFLSLTNCET